MDKVLPINTILNGDCLDLLKTLPDESVDAICTDPPYGLGTREPTGEDIEKYLRGESLDTGGDFMGKEWEIPPVAVWRECFRVLKPGGHLAAFAGTRTWDIMSVGIRAAGFEKRDTIATLFGPLSILCWVQGQGFPKSHNVFKTDIVPMVQEALVEKGYLAPFKWKHDNESMVVPGEAPETVEVKLFDIAFQITKHRENEWELPHDLVKWKGYGTALKPSFEPILVFRKPLEGTLAETVLGGGAGVIDIDGTRVKHASAEDKAAHQAMVEAIKARAGVWQGSWKNSSNLAGAADVSDSGRWPPNVIVMHSSECKQVGTKKVDAPVINQFEEGMKPFGKGAGKKYKSKQTGDAEGKEEVTVWECVDGCPVKLLNGENSSKTEKVDAAKFFPQFQIPEAPFFYTGKATRREKNEGVANKTLPGFMQLKDDLSEEQLEMAFSTCDLLHPAHTIHVLPEAMVPESLKELFEPFRGDPANIHPTVKPVKLMEWLVGLMCPKDGVVVDPYCGSGTTCLAAVNKGVRFVGIEKDPEFYSIALKRLEPVKSAQEDKEFFKDTFDFMASLDME